MKGHDMRRKIYEKNIRSFVIFELIISFSVIALSTACIPVLQKYSDATYLGDVDSGFLTNLVWSPIGNKIAVTSFNDGDNYSKIYLLDVGTREFQQVLETTYGSITATGWSPDGKQLLFSSDDGGKDFGPGIWLFDIEDKTVPGFISDGYLASWSPLGDQLAIFEIVREFQVWDISLHIRNLESSKDQMIYRTQGKYIYGLSWSPDGERLIFAIAQKENLDNVNIYNINVDSGELIQLTTTGRNSSPTWSPKGDLIAYVTEEANHDTRLYIQKSDGNCRVIVSNLKNISDPTWSPDGRYIAFIGEFGGVYKLDLLKVFGDRFLSDGITCH
jgi:TolB protein